MKINSGGFQSALSRAVALAHSLYTHGGQLPQTDWEELPYFGTCPEKRLFANIRSCTNNYNVIMITRSRYKQWLVRINSCWFHFTSSVESCDWLARSLWESLTSNDVTLCVPLPPMWLLSFTTHLYRQWSGNVTTSWGRQIDCADFQEYPCSHSHMIPYRKPSRPLQGKTASVKGAWAKIAYTHHL